MSNPARTLVEKTLSANDVADTGSHQSGVLIPKRSEILDIMPSLNKNEKNPRSSVIAFDEDGRSWHLNFIYYNNRAFGGTRDEYRLTCIKSYLRARCAHMGDVLQIERIEDGVYRIRLQPLSTFTDMEPAAAGNIVRLELTNAWRLVQW